jgi:RNA polymerase sigma factor (TIGR02999 family)
MSIRPKHATHTSADSPTRAAVHSRLCHPCAFAFAPLAIDGDGNARLVESAAATFSAVRADAMSEVTRILSAIKQGDPHAAEQLLPLVYDELRQLAAQRLAQERPGQTLQATALVHEAYLRLVGAQQAQPFNSRGHFFAAAAEAMRRILVEAARRRAALKRGGGAGREALAPAELAAPVPDQRLLAVHEAVDDLARADPEAATLVKLRFFAGMTTTEAAEALGMSVRAAHDLWAYARSWLRRHMRPE